MKKRVAQREHCEDRHNIALSLDVNSVKYLELLHIRCKDMRCLQDESNTQLKHHQQ